MKEFRGSHEWQFDPLKSEIRPEIDRRYSQGFIKTESGRRWHSFSGSERNRFFANQNGKSFVDLSALSGIDNIADGRSFAIWDHNRDGWPDIALANANNPLLNLYQNRIGLSPESAKRHFIAVRLIGGNRKALPTRNWSSRDAIGSRFMVELDDRTIVRELKLGEGFAAQNSQTLIVGIGDESGARRLTVLWPSGQRTEVENVAASQLVIVYENQQEAPNGVTYGSYAPILHHERPAVAVPRLVFSDLPKKKNQFRLVATMATWCEACTRHLPQFAHIRNSFEPDRLGLFGIPADPVETKEDLEKFVQRHRPSYQVIRISPHELAKLRLALQRSLKSDIMPASILLDDNDQILGAFPGIPTISQIASRVDSHHRSK